MRGKLGSDGQCGAERCNGDQMVSLFCETSLVFCTRRFPAPRTDLFFLFSFFFFFKVFIFSRGQRAACRQRGGFSSWRAGPAHPGHRTGRFTLASGWTLRTQLLGPPCPVQGSRSTPGVAPLSQRRLTSLAPALFRLIMEEQPQRAQASPFHPGGPGFAENT